MASKQVVDLNVEANKEMLDLTLRLGTVKGKKPIDGSTETKKRKRNQEELEDDSIARSSENKQALLEHNMEDLEKLINNSADEMVSSIDMHLMYATSCFYNQQSKSVKCMNEIYGTLRDFARSFNPRE